MHRHLTTGPSLIAALMRAHQAAGPTSECKSGTPVPRWHEVMAVLKERLPRGERAAQNIDPHAPEGRRGG